MEDCLLDCYFLCLAIETHVYNSPCFYLLLFICLFLQDLPLSFLEGGKTSPHFIQAPTQLTTRFLYLGAEIFFFLFFPEHYARVIPRHPIAPQHRERPGNEKQASIIFEWEREREKEPMFLAIYFKHIRRKGEKNLLLCYLMRLIQFCRHQLKRNSPETKK